MDMLGPCVSAFYLCRRAFYAHSVPHTVSFSLNLNFSSMSLTSFHFIYVRVIRINRRRRAYFICLARYLGKGMEIGSVGDCSDQGEGSYIVRFVILGSTYLRIFMISNMSMGVRFSVVIRKTLLSSNCIGWLLL